MFFEFVNLKFGLQDEERAQSNEMEYEKGVFWNCLGGEVKIPLR